MWKKRLEPLTWNKTQTGASWKRKQNTLQHQTAAADNHVNETEEEAAWGSNNVKVHVEPRPPAHSHTSFHSRNF